MKSIILAAGIGRRLLPLTEDKPKCLLKVGSKSILEYQLQNLAKCKIQEIVIVTGHGLAEVKDACKTDVVFIHNEYYASTNNIYSLWLAKDQAKEGFILLNGDVFFHEKILKNLIASKYSDCLAIDNYKELGEEEMKVKINSGILYEINKTMPPSKSDGEYIGLAKFSSEGSKMLFNEIEKFINRSELGVWYENAFQEMMRHYALRCVSTEGLPWIEIDDHSDLEKARSVMCKRILNEA